MLAVKDHLDRALATCPRSCAADETVKSFVAGIEATLRELDAVFARHGIARVEAMGQPLDPHKHQAMIEIATDEAEPGTIVEEMQSGYMIKDRPAAAGAGRGGEGSEVAPSPALRLERRGLNALRASAFRPWWRA